MTTAINWAPLTVTWTSLTDGFRIHVTTDVPCHLYMAWSLITPKKHDVEILLRGLRIAQDPYYCMAAPHDNEQEEAGDTLVHTFDKRTWPVCETRYFYFWGFVGALQSPSATAIFSLHRTDTPIPTEWGWHTNTADNRTIRANHILWLTVHDAPTGEVGPWHGAPTYRIVAGARLTASYWIERAFLRFDTSGIPAGSTITAATLRLWIQGWQRTSSALYDELVITRGLQSSPILPTDYGAQLPETQPAGEIELTALVADAWALLPLNDFGLTLLDLTGTTHFCLRQGLDLYNHQPPLGNNQAWWNSYQGPGVMRPQLNVWYIPP